MIAKRIIPCLDIRDGRVVKGVNFEGIRDVEDPVQLAAFYNEQGADELVFYDITASAEGRSLFTDILKQVASQVFIPLTVGGAVNTVADFDRVLKSGADKVSVNSGAVANPQLIYEGARRYGSQCVVLSMDVKRVDGAFHIFIKGGRVDTGIDALEWAARGETQGAGELVVNSMDTDGVKQGFDLPLLQAVAERVKIPIIASGGAGSMQHFAQLFEVPGMDAGLAASIFHYRQIGIMELKRYLAGQGIPMRLA
ncbi:MAG: imidazole glycerol phosphate synthase subunit HisF [Oscillospiraceae bacterium]